MSSYTSRKRGSPPSLIVAAARCAVRSALRPYLQRKNIAFVVVLHVPAGTCEYYKWATEALLADPMPVDAECNDLVNVMALYDHAVDARSLFVRYRQARQIVILTERPEHVPLETKATADLVTEIAPPTAEHFLAAAKVIDLPGMTPGLAELMTGFSFDIIAAASRGRRPLASVARHLRRAVVEEETEKPKPEPTKPVGPRLEELEGYGQAKTWGLQLGDDLRAWKAGELAWEDVDRGMLLYGPPGTGKTSYAKALANSCEVSLVVASAARWQSAGHLGDFLNAMRASFAEAKKLSPSILFVDEFDSFGDREASGDQHHRDYRRQAVNGMLECLDPVEGREGVIVLGATNDPSGIDRALLRSGRLETIIEIPLPDAAARVAILRHHLRGATLVGDLDRFVSATINWSGADIEKVARDARRISRRQNAPLSVDLILAAMPPRYVLREGELRHSAIHEAGHAIVGVILGCDILDYVSIARDAAIGPAVQSVGSTAFEKENGRIITVEYYDDRIAMLLGGIAAETLVYGTHSNGAGGAPSSDLLLASDTATRIERHYGFGEALSVELGKGDRPLEFLRNRDPELRRLVDVRMKAQFDRATAILLERSRELDLLAEQLFVNGYVTGEEVRALCHTKSRNTASVAP